MHEQYGNEISFVGVAGRDRIEPIVSFVEEFSVDAFPHAIDDTGEIWQTFGIFTQPSFAFIDDDGTVTTHMGPLGIDGLSSRLSDLAAR